MVAYYLRIEGVNQSEFVYDTQDLSTIRGGGLMLLDAVDYVASKATGAKLEAVTTGASWGIFRFEAQDDAQAGRLREEAERILRGHLVQNGKQYELNHATFVVDVIKASGDFVADREALLALNRWRQMRSPSLAIPSQNHGDWRQWMQCEVDLVRPAVATMQGPEGPKKVSASVKTRRDYGTSQKQAFYARQTRIHIGKDFSRDFTELTTDPSKGNLNRKMAVIYLDGNRFGELQNRLCRDIAAQSEFDSTIKTYRREFLKSLLEDLVFQDVGGWVSQQDRYRQDRYRMEILLWGGDEIILVVPAWQGWRVLDFFYRQSAGWHFDGEPLTHAAGVVFCHQNAPISRIKDLADRLATLAKDKSRDENLFAYQVLESFDHIGRDLLDFRKERVPLGHDASELILPGDNMGIVQTELPKLREVIPRRKLHLLVQLLRSDLGKAQEVEKEIVDHVLADSEARQAFAGIEGYFGRTKTMWFHIADLWEYLLTS